MVAPLRLRVLFCVLIPVGSTAGDRLGPGDEESPLSNIVGGDVGWIDCALGNLLLGNAQGLRNRKPAFLFFQRKRRLTPFSAF
jgi:hypothetical protein